MLWATPVRSGGLVINAVVLLATGVNGDGHREVLGMRVATSETGAAWNEFFADLVARGLTGVQLVTSDAHQGLVEAIAANLPGASWQRCPTHYAANLMSVTPKSMWPTPWASSPPATPSSAWSGPSWPSRQTNGPKAASTSDSKSSPAAASTPSPTTEPEIGADDLPALTA